MNVKQLHEALGKMIEDHGEADVAHVNGVGKATKVCGWELVTSAAFDHRIRGHEDKQMLKLFTSARF